MTHRPLIPYVLGNCVAILGGIAIALLGFAYLDSTSFVDALIKDTDFLPCYSAGHLVLTGHAGDVYSLSRTFAVEKWVTLPLHPRTVNAYPYPPFHALLVSPLSLLPYDAAFAV